MRQLIFRAFGLAAIVLLSNVPLARATVGWCYLTCCNGEPYIVILPSGQADCCQIFHDRCGGLGEVHQDAPDGPMVCLSYCGTCGGPQD